MRITAWTCSVSIVVASALLAGCDEPTLPPTGPAAEATEPAEKPAPKSDETSAQQPGEPTVAVAAEASDGPSSDPNPAADTAPPASAAKVQPASNRPRADRTKVAGVEQITFDDLILGMSADMVFRPWMLEANGGRAKELDGQRVRLAGIMHGGVKSQTKNKEFVLLRNKECKFGPGGQADHLAMIVMKPGKTAAYQGDETVVVEGRLKIEPVTGDDGNTWSLYNIEEAEVK